MGYGGAAAVLGVMVWIVFSLIFNPQRILPNFPGSGADNSGTLRFWHQLLPPKRPPRCPLHHRLRHLQPTEDERCTLFEEIEISLVMLNIIDGTYNIPVYLKDGRWGPRAALREGMAAVNRSGLIGPGWGRSRPINVICRDFRTGSTACSP